MSGPADAVLGAVFSLLVDVLFYGTGRLVLPLVTFGRVRVERAVRAEGLRFGWLGTARDDKHRLVLSGEIGALFGFVVWVSVIVAAIVLLRQ